MSASPQGAITPEYLDLRGAAAFLSFSVNYLVELERKGDGPQRSKVGRSVRYNVRDLRGWMDSKKVLSVA